MRKQYFTLLLLFTSCMLQAQVTVNVMAPPAGMVPKDQLWNIAIGSNSAATYTVNVYLSLQDAVTGQTVLTAGSRSITLSKGVKMLQPRDVQPVQYTSTGIGFDGNFLPMGSYVACYTITRLEGDGFEDIARECIRIQVSPLSPPLLNTPANKDTLKTTYPQFSWTPPTPLNMFTNLEYDLSVAEVMPGQSASEAILYNNPLYLAGRLRQPLSSYPSSYSRLEPGKTYVWQVTARNGAAYAAATEAWTFTVAKDTMAVTTQAYSYVRLRSSQERAGVHYIKADDVLHISYYSYDKTREAVITLLGVDRKPIREIRQQVAYGDNYLTIPLGRSFQKGQLYIIELKDLKNTSYTAAFGIQ